MNKSKIVEQATADAIENLNEWTDDDVLQSLRPDQLEADEALLNGIGCEATARLFGVEQDGPEWSDALSLYNQTHRAVVFAEAKSRGLV